MSEDPRDRSADLAEDAGAPDEPEVAMTKERPLLRLFLVMFVNLTAFGVAIPILPALCKNYGGAGLAVGHEIVHEDHAVARPHVVAGHAQSLRGVLGFIAALDAGAGQLVFLPQHEEGELEPGGRGDLRSRP